MDEMGALSYRVWYYASLQYDEDQRDNTINARRQQVQILFAKAARAMQRKALLSSQCHRDRPACRPADSLRRRNLDHSYTRVQGR